MKIPELVWGILAGFLGGLAILFAPLPFLAPAQIPSLKFYVVSSGSMEPSIKLGSAILVMPKNNYLPGDVITFYSGGDKKNPVTHRIMVKNLGDKTYSTAGDANGDFDRSLVNEQDIVGGVALSLPYLGYLINFAKLPYGFLLLVIIPATIIIYEELKTIKKELLKNLKLRPFHFISLQKDKTSFSKIFSFLPVLGACLVFVAVSSSFFLDTEQSLNNIFSAATTFPQPSSSPTPSPTPTPAPIAQTLVINEVLPDTSCLVGQNEAQWIEVYNGFSVTVNLKDFKLTDGNTNTTIDLVTSNTNIAAGGFALIAHSNGVWTQCYSDNGVITANFGGQLDIDTKFLQLKDASNVILDTVKWGSGTDDGGNPLDTPAQNESIERDPDGLDSATGTAFNESDFVERTTPQPGL